MELAFKIGHTQQLVDVAERNLMGVLIPEALPRGTSGQEAVRRALAVPYQSPPLRQVVKRGEKIVVVTSDITRPMPTAAVMPALLEELYAAGAAPEDITLLFALGSHRRHTQAERRQLAGERAWREILCVDSDSEDCVCVGTTRRGTPVELDRRVVQADRRICLGNIEYHYFAGYSGGAKAIMPGVATRRAIQANHSAMTEPGARAGRLAGNPVREDLEEAAAMVGVDFLVNVVLDPQKRILRTFAGDVTAAHRAGCAYLDSLYQQRIPGRADIVIVSQGGAPKDLNLYQTQKALDNARHAVKDGGVIILIGSCREGLGENVFARWLREAPSSHALVERIHREFQLGGHKAAAIAMVLERADIYLVSELEDDQVRGAFLTPFHTVRDAYQAALCKCGPDAAVLAMPYGGSTLPVVQS